MTERPLREMTIKTLNRVVSTMRAGCRALGAGVLAALVALATIFALAVPATAQPAQPSFQTIAPIALLIDAGSGTVLFEKAPDELFGPASLVKMMTAAVVFEELVSGRLMMETEFGISENAWRRGGGPSGGSSMFAPLNSRVKVSDLLQGLLVQSGNDAAIALAEGIAGNEEVFARKMTERARAIGLQRSQFRNATGFTDPAQRVTAREMAQLALHLIRTYPEPYKIFGQREFTWNKVRQLNRNPLLTMDIGADGLKTGQIEESGFSLVGSAVQGERRLIMVMSGLKSARDRQVEGRKLMEWGLRSFEERKLLNKAQAVGDVRVFGGGQASLPVGPAGDVAILLPRGTADRLTARIVYRGPLKAPIAKGTEVARLRITRAEISALDVPLVALEDIAEGTLRQRATDSLVEFGGQYVRQLFGKLQSKGAP